MYWRSVDGDGFILSLTLSLRPRAHPPLHGQGSFKRFLFYFLNKTITTLVLRFFFIERVRFFLREIYIFKTLENQYIKNIGKSQYKNIVNHYITLNWSKKKLMKKNMAKKTKKNVFFYVFFNHTRRFKHPPCLHPCRKHGSCGALPCEHSYP
jgi:hypothetical protein